MDLNFYAKKWRTAWDAYTGGGGFSAESGKKYIIPHPREDETKLMYRKQRTIYENVFAKRVNRYISFIFSKSETISVPDKLGFFKKFFKAVDSVTDYDYFIKQVAISAKVRGVAVVAVLPAETDGIPIVDVIENSLFPRLSIIEPENIINYEIKNGAFRFVEYYSGNVIVKIDENSVSIKNIDESKAEIVEHGLGFCPVLAMSENGHFPSTGEFTPCGDLCVKLFNLKSELDEILSSQTFPVLTVQSQKALQRGGELELEVGVNNALLYPPGADRPEFISPSRESAESYEKRIESIENLIFDITYELKQSSQRESGVALEFRYRSLAESLSDFAKTLEKFENKLLKLVARVSGVFDESEIEQIDVMRKKKFTIVDIEKELNVLSEIRDTIPSETYIVEKIKEIVRYDIDPSDEIMSKIEAEISRNISE